MSNPRIRFEPFREVHLPLLAKWLREPHVKGYWHATRAGLASEYAVHARE